MISSDYHTKKTGQTFLFHILLERHKLDVSHSLYIGNDSRCDVGGAKGVGMPVFYVNSIFPRKMMTEKRQTIL